MYRDRRRREKTPATELNTRLVLGEPWTAEGGTTGRIWSGADAMVWWRRMDRTWAVMTGGFRSVDRLRGVVDRWMVQTVSMIRVEGWWNGRVWEQVDSRSAEDVWS